MQVIQNIGVLVKLAACKIITIQYTTLCLLNLLSQCVQLLNHQFKHTRAHTDNKQYLDKDTSECEKHPPTTNT